MGEHRLQWTRPAAVTAKVLVRSDWKCCRSCIYGKTLLFERVSEGDLNHPTPCHAGSVNAGLQRPGQHSRGFAGPGWVRFPGSVPRRGAPMTLRTERPNDHPFRSLSGTGGSRVDVFGPYAQRPASFRFTKNRAGVSGAPAVEKERLEAVSRDGSSYPRVLRACGWSRRLRGTIRRSSRRHAH